ncbi:MAG: hypothetical protein NTX45_07855 [Proteobacteria bacterium]|nr:hypothetical protein [Pseudomonadota bacterium]
MNTPAQESVCYDFLYSFAQWLLRHSELEGRESDAKDLEKNLAGKIDAFLEDYPACDALIRFRSYLEAEVERYRSVNDERRKLIVENVKNDFDKNISGLVGIASENADNHDKKCRELARKDWLNHVDFMELIWILDGVKSLGLDEARIEDKQYLVESFKGCLPSEKLILLNESPAFPCTPMELADWFKQIKLPLNKIIPSFFDELTAIEATKAETSPEPGQTTGGEEAGNRQGQEMDANTKANKGEAIRNETQIIETPDKRSINASKGGLAKRDKYKPVKDYCFKKAQELIVLDKDKMEYQISKLSTMILGKLKTDKDMVTHTDFFPKPSTVKAWLKKGAESNPDFKLPDYLSKHGSCGNH